MHNKQKISIITVTYNAAQLIEPTMKSVIEQTYPDIEYIIIDGKSTDNTIKIINRYQQKIDKIIVEKDRNNYEAMNKGFKHATGDYIWFLHAGDIIYDQDVITNICSDAKNEDFIYGKVKVKDQDGQLKEWHKPHPPQNILSWQTFINGMVICHQAMLVKRNIWLNYQDQQYNLSADLDWSIRTLQQAGSVRNTGIYWCYFADNGLTVKNRWRSLYERFLVLIHHFGIWPAILQHIKMFFRVILNRRWGY